MKLRQMIAPTVTLLFLGAGAYAAYRVQERWVPYVFPAKPATKPEAPAGDHDAAAKQDRVKLSPQAQQNLGLDVDTLSPQPYWRTILIPGSVVDRPGESDRSVTTKIAGIIAEIHSKPGATVKAGEPLFTMQLVSEFLQSTQAELSKVGKEMEIATARRDRVADLVRKGTQSEATLLDEENQIKRLTTQAQTYRRQLQLFGLTTEQVNQAEKGVVVTEMTVAVPGQASVGSPLYEVQELKVALGEQVTAGQTLCLLANHQKLYVEGRAFKSEADALAAAAQNKTPIRAEFVDETVGTWPPQEPLQIHHLSNQVDTTTRTFGFYLPLENQPKTFVHDGKTHFIWRYRPGQRVWLRVPVEELLTLADKGKKRVLPFVLPVGAVVREGPEAYVFVQNGDLFVRKPVRVLHEDRENMVIANDGSITEAEFVVRNQAAAINRALKAMAAEGAGGHGHSHSHEH